MTDHASLSAALVAALGELTVIEKAHKAKAGAYSYDYADIADVVKVTRPVLKEHGLVALTPVHAYENGLACSVILMHASGERLNFEPFPFPHGKDAQATGSMVTYHRRYALLAALGMAAGDDDDGAAAVAKAPEKPEVRTISPANAKTLIAKAKEAGLDVAEVVKIGTKGRISDAHEVLLSEVPAVKEALDNLTPAEGEVTA